MCCACNCQPLAGGTKCAKEKPWSFLCWPRGRATPPESTDQYSFQLVSDSIVGMQLDPSGNFSWQPGYDVVKPTEPRRRLPSAFAVRSSSGQTATQSADLVVYNQARISDPPNQPPFFVKEDLKKLILLVKIEKVTELELDASWKNPKKASDKNIQNTFRDFNPDPDKSS